MAMRQSVSILILRTPCLIRWISSTGTPKVCGISPPNSLMMSCRSCGTEDEPCMTRCGSAYAGSRMTMTIRPLTPNFAGEVSGADLACPLTRDDVATLEAGMAAGLRCWSTTINP